LTGYAIAALFHYFPYRFRLPDYAISFLLRHFMPRLLFFIIFILIACHFRLSRY
jgi:hypothetical protein